MHAHAHKRAIMLRCIRVYQCSTASRSCVRPGCVPSVRVRLCSQRSRPPRSPASACTPASSSPASSAPSSSTLRTASTTAAVTAMGDTSLHLSMRTQVPQTYCMPMYAYICAGVVAGVLGSWVGMGGAFVVIPFLTGVIGLNQHKANGTNNALRTAHK
jgi:hypothetical protein